MKHEQKKPWVAPTLTLHGSVKEITQQFKNKTLGGGDDVLVNNQAILANLGS